MYLFDLWAKISVVEEIQPKYVGCKGHPATAGVYLPDFHAPHFGFISQDMPTVSSLLSMAATPIITQPRPILTPRDSGVPLTSHQAMLMRPTNGCTQTLARQLVDPASVTSLSSTRTLTTITAPIRNTTPAGVVLTDSMSEEVGANATDTESLQNPKVPNSMGCLCYRPLPASIIRYHIKICSEISSFVVC